MVLKGEERRPETRVALEQVRLLPLLLQLPLVEPLDSLEVAVAHEASHAGDEPGHRRRAQLVLRGLDQVAQHPNAPREVGRALHPVDQRRVEQECPLQGERAVLTMGGAVDPAARGDEVDVVLGAG